MVIEKGNSYILKCDKCGKISSFKEMKIGGGGSWKFVPNSDQSREEDEFRCKKCTVLLGSPTPTQKVKKNRCCGIY